MQFSRDKTKMTATVITMVLLMASVMLIAVPVQPVQAQLSTTQPVSGPLPAGANITTIVTTAAFLSVTPSPVGVGQMILVNIWCVPGVGTNRKLLDYKVTITKPDGTKVVEVMNSYLTDSTAWFNYIPDQVGEYKFKFENPGTYFPPGRYLNGYIVTNTSGTLYSGTYWKPSSTPETPLTVQSEMVASWPPQPLPTDYWTRPVAAEFREWWPILGDFPWRGPGGGVGWPADTNPYFTNSGGGGMQMPSEFVPYVQAPNTAHIVWKKQLWVIGLYGAGWKGNTLSTTGGLPSFFDYMPDIIWQGRCYQQVTKVSQTGTGSQNYWQCYDLRTGELYWERPFYPGETKPNLIEYPVGAPGAITGTAGPGMPNLMYIGGGYLRKYNPDTGVMTLNVSISPLTTGTTGYYMNMYCASVQNIGNATVPNYRLINWTTYGTSDNFTSRIVSNITWPFSSLSGLTDFNVGVSASVSSTSATNVTSAGTRIVTASLATGAVLANVTQADTNLYGSKNVADHGKVAIFDTLTGCYYAYDLFSGKLVWTSEKLDYPWDACGFSGYSAATGYGLLFNEGYSGIYAINWTNGKIAWKYEVPTPYQFETPYTGRDGVEVYSFDSGLVVADGKVFAVNFEHSPTTPLSRGWRFNCINATTGKGIWNYTGTSYDRVLRVSVADGYVVFPNYRDGNQYCFGKGKSATTVSAPQTAVPLGTSVLIQGTVLDQSPAQPGTPCVSAASMTTQMEHIHLQFPIDGFSHDVQLTGVPVTLTAIGSDGTVIDIGTVTTNGYYGTFSLAWTPPKEDTYTIMATFAGDDSYGSSAAGTGLLVGPAPAAPTAPAAPAAAAAQDNTPLYIATIAIIIAIAIVGALILRKRP